MINTFYGTDYLEAFTDQKTTGGTGRLKNISNVSYDTDYLESFIK